MMSSSRDLTTIRVQAPATLAEGYKFDVMVDDEPFTITIPPGGVVEGQEFDVPYYRNDQDDDDESRTLAAVSSSQAF